MTPTVPVVKDDTTMSPPARTVSICLINPRFEPSYWGFEYALPLYPGDKRSTMISGSLSTVAGLCGNHRVFLLDENVEDIDWDSVSAYDIVGVTGMNVQKTRIREILLPSSRPRTIPGACQYPGPPREPRPRSEEH